MRALLAALLIICVAGPAAARSCAEAQRALAAAQGGGGGGREAAALQQQAKAFGCGKTSMFGRAPQCAGIEARLRRVSGGGDGRTIRRLQAEVNRACAAPAPSRSREPQRVVRERPREVAPNGAVILHGTRQDNKLDARANRGNFFTRLFGAAEEEVIVETVRADPSAPTKVERHSLDGDRPRRDADAPAEIRTLATGDGSKRLREGGYRTMCVRLCDGFYFPINSRSHSDNFYEELAMCVGRCPGADVSLYVHDANGAVEGMRSAMTGEPYVRLPTAFVYRKALVPSCGCEPQTVIAADQNADKALSYVRGDATGAEAAAEAAAAPGGWTPLKAVYDATGEPLDLSIGVEQVAKPRTADPATTPPTASTLATAPTGAATVTPVAASSIPATATADTAGETIRTVGGQFFSDAPTAADTLGLGLPRRLLPGGAGAVKLVPLAPAASAPDAPAAAGAAATETSEAQEPAAPDPAEAAAATGATSTATVAGGRRATAAPAAATTDG